ncbi:hypothetical protein BT63DRAFT_436877 [Microthyrium microscopicum]|uniref:3'-5' exonuclease domain-containing protein n=1 Tax=Microthyrium microscopicum TaxID=703497 RepID=A0A6A6UPR9_9PEZI|nr:hypothetical protein BT63DRAFT_436877 [Microthyrium microscopicum]
MASSSSINASALIRTVSELQTFLSSITKSSKLYLDFHGIVIGLIAPQPLHLLTILISSGANGDLTRVIDLDILGQLAFTTPSSNGQTLRDILADATIQKCLWDVTKAVFASKSVYRIHIASVLDMQLLENAKRHGGPGNTRLQRDVFWKSGNDGQQHLLPKKTLDEWRDTREVVESRKDPRKFIERPLDARVLQYCVNQVVHYPMLYDLWKKGENMERLADESERRLREGLERLERLWSESNKPAPRDLTGPWREL